ncbi:hypothetical protein KOW79_000170 [Hemibagrus wyckioides]|uniref:Uncharacterized protein n=1 Tax=Hemibagrus wyckioides TaxID=337641 RepID=A0A9D3PAI9_9TELE|nr:hypothetical protein KOW79_000170 [Hemibagrus wyckioides]
MLVSVGQTAQVGLIHSPGYPHGYGPKESVTWIHCAPSGHVLILMLLHLDLEESFNCENDFLKVDDRNGSQLVKLCGRKTLEELQSVNHTFRSSTGSCLSITFQSDNSTTETHTGFKLFYTAQDVDECVENTVKCSHFCLNYKGGYSCSCKPGYYLGEDQHECHVDCTEQHHGMGLLTSAGTPGPYFENTRCSFRLSVDKGFQLRLRFIVFDVESRDGKCVDFVKVKTPTKTFGPFCGKDKPANILTNSRHAEVIFHSNLEGTNQGFILEYKPKGTECPTQVTANSIMLPKKDWYSVGESGTDTFVSRCQLNGEWSPKSSCQLVNCGIPELPDLMELTEEDPETTYKHNISIKCREFYKLEGKANFTCEATGEWVADNGEVLAESSSQCVPECGITRSFIYGLGFHGQKAKLGQIPWHLLVKQARLGAASLINDQWAVTAAHVVQNQTSLTFIGGMIDIEDENMVEMETEKIIIHPNYTIGTYDNDIALVKMSSRVPLSSYLLPVCLPEEKTNGPVLENMKGTVSGFGVTGKWDIQFLYHCLVMEYPGVCFDTNLTVTENMFCAGKTAKDRYSCTRDGGGPLFIPMLWDHYQSPYQRFYQRFYQIPYRLMGIVSWGPPEHGNDDHDKGYYTKVENYLNWIMDTMKNN